MRATAVFCCSSPTIAVVTNIDKEHMDFHQTMERLNESFLTFINKMPFYGLAVLCIDDANVRALLPKAKKRFATYGLPPEADFSAEDLKMTASRRRIHRAARRQELGQAAFAPARPPQRDQCLGGGRRRP